MKVQQGSSIEWWSSRNSIAKKTNAAATLPIVIANKKVWLAFP